MIKFKRFLISIFFLGLGLVFIYGYIKVYTTCYNTTHQDKIVGWALEYHDNNINLTICGKKFNIKL